MRFAFRSTRCQKYADNIPVFGSTQEEHDANVIRFLERCLEIDLHLNPDKVKINCSSVPFFGLGLTAGGIKPDPKKVETIKKWPIPQNVTELQSFLGSVNYLSRFIPGLSQSCKLLQALIKKNSEYVWTTEHDKALQNLKDMVSEDCLIQFYNPYKPLFIECDVSKQGIGCVMLQPDDNIPADMTMVFHPIYSLLLMLQRVCLRLNKIMPTLKENCLVLCFL